MRFWTIPLAIAGVTLIVALAGLGYPDSVEKAVKDASALPPLDEARLPVLSGRRTLPYEATREPYLPWPPSPEALFPPPEGERLTHLLHEIQLPSDGVNRNGLFIGGGGLPYQYRVYIRARWAVEALKHAEPGVEKILFEIAHCHGSWDARCRAAAALVERKSPYAAAVLADRIGSEVLAERYVAWGLAEDAARAGLGPAVTIHVALQALANSTDHWLDQTILAYLDAVPDAAALPALLHPAKQLSERLRLRVLARIGTPEAMAPVIAALDGPDVDEAIDALTKAGGPAAIQALRDHLAILESRDDELRGDSDEERTRNAIDFLGHPDPCSMYMDMLEDETRPANAHRFVADLLRKALRDADSADLARVVRLLREATDETVGMQLAWALEDSRVEGVTEALLERAFTWSRPLWRHGRLWAWQGLVHALNRRLGEDFENLEDVRTFAKGRRLSAPPGGRPHR